jgi:RNA polymerase-binding transcription factor DksA
VWLLFEGHYGRCVDCRMAIPPARLQALPFAIRCLACQERLENETGRWRLGPPSRERGTPGSKSRSNA